MIEDDVNPMHPAPGHPAPEDLAAGATTDLYSSASWRPALEAARGAPRCTARSKRTGEPCHAPAVTGWTVCRMHGARGGHSAGPSHPSWRHGTRAQAWLEERRTLNDLVRELRELEQLL